MPKEQINTPSNRVVIEHADAEPGFGYYYLNDGDEFPSGPDTHMEHSPVLHVGWSKPESHALPTECVVFYVDIAEDEILRAADEILRKRRRQANPEERPEQWWSQMYQFHTTVVSRPELNNTIKAIRRARDTVFGGDE